jgi:hypothetical protein
MIAEISMAIGLVGQITQLAKNPVIEPAIKRLRNWVSGMFNDPADEEKLSKLESSEIDKESVDELSESLQKKLEGNAELIKELNDNLDLLKQNKGIQENIGEINKNIVTITGNNNAVITGLSSGGDITINF